MAVALVSVLVGSMLENLSSVLLKEAGLARGLQTDLESTLSTLQAVLHDAEKKQLKSEAVRNWLTKLKAAAYDAEDVVDEFAIEVQRRKQPRGLINPLQCFFSLDQNPLIFVV
jgi:structure-specific endonuclease subunit SLX1